MTTLRPEPNAVSQPTPPAPTGSPSLLLQAPGASEKIRRGIGIRTLVVVSFVVPIVAAVGATGWLAIRNSQRAVLDTATQLRTETTARVQQQLDDYLETPHLINQINVADIEVGELDLQNIPLLERHLWRQIQLFPNVSYVYVGTEEAIFSGAEPNPDGSPNVAFWSGSSSDRAAETYATDEQGNRTELITTNPGYNLFERAWYLTAQEAGRPVWGDIYVWAFPYPEVALPAVHPIYNGAGVFQGVFAADLSLLRIGDFLQTLEVGTTGEVFIMERSGLLVAASTDDPLFVEEGEEQVRLQATQSENALITGAADYLNQTFGDLSQISQTQQLEFQLGGENQLLQVTPYQDEFGLDWLIVVAIPESDFLAPINASTRNTIILCIVALLVASLVGFLIARWITNPVILLSQASQAIAQGDLEQRLDASGIGELDVMAQSFNQMSHRLRLSFTALEEANTELEDRVTERTAALNEQTETLQHEVEHLLDIVSVVEEGNLTVAAEVNPTVTGLVADTFNRLIKRFSQIMTEVSEAAEQVNQRTEQIQTLAVNMADNARQQVRSVTQVQELMENINDLSQGNVQYVAATDQAVNETQSAVEQGQQEIGTVTNDIGVLQQEMQQIIGRTQTLTNYTDLAAQFVKDQKRIASLTRVLAMNASMLSTRASQQQDPTQFAAITREFETVATQVNELAAQTNQSLVVLQQRTEQIQTVVSGLNHDVENIGQRTDSLTSGIDQSSQAFEQIKVTTSQVAELGQQVTQSSQAIAAAAQTTLQSVQDISSIAIKTSEGANLTTEQSQTMEQVAQMLQQSVALFQLPAADPNQANEATTVLVDSSDANLESSVGSDGDPADLTVASTVQETNS